MSIDVFVFPMHFYVFPYISIAFHRVPSISSCFNRFCCIAIVLAAQPKSCGIYIYIYVYIYQGGPGSRFESVPVRPVRRSILPIKTNIKTCIVDYYGRLHIFMHIGDYIWLYIYSEFIVSFFTRIWIETAHQSKNNLKKNPIAISPKKVSHIHFLKKNPILIQIFLFKSIKIYPF